MWWYGGGWWWWWLAFVIFFFLLPLGYGWGYRGWGPWYRRSSSLRRRRVGGDPIEPVSQESDSGWGWLGIALWVVLILAIIWPIGAWGWGY
jgi:hypothetical protein